MNYYAARQLGADSEAPGKWNWSRMNDHQIWTSAPCSYPDFDWDAAVAGVNPMDLANGVVKLEPTGRPRCDHDTEMEAILHVYEYEMGRLRERTFTSAHRCRAPHEGEAPWTDKALESDVFMDIMFLCDEHRNPETYRELHPAPKQSFRVTSSW